MKVKKNDTVVVITGKDVKKTGKVIKALPKQNRVVVEGVNLQEKNHKARTAQDTSRKIKQEGPIDASNVLVICPNCDKATRVGYQIIDGKKVRICKHCKASLDVKVVKETVKKEAKKAAPVEKPKAKTAEQETEKKPAAKKTTTTKTTTAKATASKSTTAKKTTTKVADGEKAPVKKTSTKKVVKEETTDAQA